MVKVIVLRAAGINCDKETAFAFEKCGAKVDSVHISLLLKKQKKLEDYQILAIPGGFSYGDDIESGRILANELRFTLRKELGKFVESGKLVIGICNGFQVLVSTGLLPGISEKENDGFLQTAALMMNESGKYEDRWVNLKESSSGKCVFTKSLAGKNIYLPVAHGEGKFMLSSKKVLSEIVKNNQIVFSYINPPSIKSKKVEYPYNPNGSMLNIAGICNPAGNVLGMMPHPERFLFKYNHPRWTRENLKEQGDGLAIFKNAVEYAKKHL